MKVNNGGNTSYQVFGQGFSVEEYAQVKELIDNIASES